MTEIGVQFSITDAPLQVVTKTTTARRRKSPLRATPGNLFNHHQRSHQMQYSSVLPIISLPTLSYYKEKLVRMQSNNKSTKQTTTPSSSPTEFRLKMPPPDTSQIKLRTTSSHRPVASNIPKSSLSYPTIVTHSTTPYRSNHHQQQQSGASFLYVVNTPVTTQRAVSTRLSNSSLHPLPLDQQPQSLASPILPHPHPQYGPFLAYLRRKSIAHTRRQQQQQQHEGNIDNIETKITLNSIRPPTQLFQSTSNTSLGTLTLETSSMPTISLTSKPKQKTRTLSYNHQLQRSSSSSTKNYRLNLNQSHPLKSLPTPSPRTLIKKTSDNKLLLSTSSLLITPTNSVIDETTLSPTKKTPYELQLKGDMLNYCYVSDSGVKYKGQLLSTPV